MAKAYSDDLRRKLMEAHQQREGSLAELAKRFHVSDSWARKVSAAFGRTGSWKRPPTGRRGRRSKFTAEIRERVSEWIDEQSDLTLHELQARLWSELKLKASIGRLWKLLREMGLRLKRSRSTPPNKTRKPTKNGAPRGESK